MDRAKWLSAVAIVCAVIAVLAYFFLVAGENGKETAPVEHTGVAATSARSFSSGAQPEPRDTATIPVAGVVRDELGSPVGGAVVHVRLASVELAADSQMDMQASEPTAADGRFALHVPVGGAPYSFRASANGFASESVIVVVPEEGLEDLVLTLVQASSLAGRVLTLDKEAIAGVTIWAHSKSDTDVRAQAPTGSDGEFLISNLREGVYSLSAVCNTPATAPRGWRGESYGDRATEKPLAVVALEPGEQRSGVEVILPWSNASGITGRTVDESGNPVAGASVWAAYDPMSLRPAGLAAEKTDSNGEFHIPYVAQGGPAIAPDKALTLAAERPGYERGYLSDVVKGSANNTLVLSAAARGYIDGEVLDQGTGQPIAGAHVYFMGVSTDWGDYVFGESGYLGKVDRTTDRTGHFMIDDVQTGLASLLVYHEDYGIASKDGIAIAKDQATPVTMLLNRAGSIRITIDYVEVFEGTTAHCYLTYWSADQADETNGLGLNRSMLNALEGKPAPPHEMVNEGVHEMVLSPGEYHVAVAVNPFPQTYDVLRSHRVAWHDIVEVRPGETTQVTVEIGGTAAVQGYVDLPDANVQDPREVRLAVFLVRGDDLSSLEESVKPFDLGSGSGDTWWQARLPAELGYYQQTWVINGSYVFPGVPEGTYSLAVAAEPAAKGEPYRVLARKRVEAREEAIANVDLP